MRTKWIVTVMSAAVLAAGPATGANAAKSKPERQVVAAAMPQQGQAAAAPSSQPALPAPEAMVILIRSSLVALSQANTTNNYTVLSSLGSENFRAANPPARLAQVFASFRANQIDLTPVTFVAPQLTQQPRIENGRMRLVGQFPTQPMSVNFDMIFEPSGSTWKLFGLGVNLAQVGAQQPQQAPISGR